MELIAILGVMWLLSRGSSLPGHGTLPNANIGPLPSPWGALPPNTCLRDYVWNEAQQTCMLAPPATPDGQTVEDIIAQQQDHRAYDSIGNLIGNIQYPTDVPSLLMWEPRTLPQLPAGGTHYLPIITSDVDSYQDAVWYWYTLNGYVFGLVMYKTFDGLYHPSALYPTGCEYNQPDFTILPATVPPMAIIPIPTAFLNTQFPCA